MVEPAILSMIISNLIFELFGFGPSKSICDPFAQQVIAEAEWAHYDLKLPER